MGSKRRGLLAVCFGLLLACCATDLRESAEGKADPDSFASFFEKVAGKDFTRLLEEQGRLIDSVWVKHGKKVEVWSLDFPLPDPQGISAYWTDAARSWFWEVFLGQAAPRLSEGDALFSNETYWIVMKAGVPVFWEKGSVWDKEARDRIAWRASLLP